MNWKGRISIRPFDPPTAPDPTTADGTPEAATTRECFFGGAAPVATPIFRGPDLKTGDTVSGPAIIEEPTTTIVVYPGMSARLSAADSYILDCR